MNSRNRIAACVHASIAVMGFSTPAMAFDWALQTRAGVVNSDNVAQAPEPLADSATIGAIELTGAVEHSTRTLLLDAEGVHTYRNFFSREYSNEQRSQLRASLEWVPIRDILRIAVSDTYGQLALNPAEGLLPSQYEDANVVTVGPTLTLPLGADTRMVASGEYREASYSDSPIDTQRRYGQFGVEHAMSRLFTLFATASKGSTDFDVAGVSRGYDVASFEAGFDGIGRRTAVSFRAGIDSLEYGADKFDGTVFQLDLERRVSRGARLFIAARREVTDAAQVFALGQISDPALTSIRDVQITPQPMLRSQYRAAWVWSGSRVDVNLQSGFISEKFDELPQDPLLAPGIDRIVREYGVGMTYRFRGGSTLNGSLELLREHFQGGQRSNDLFSTLAYTHALTDKLGLELRAQQIERTDSPRNFKELRMFAFVRYAFREMREQRHTLFDRSFESRTQRSRSTGTGTAPPGTSAD